MKNSYTVALAQIDGVIGDVKSNIERHRVAVQNAKEGGADLIVFPELSLSGYSVKDMNWDLALRLDDPLSLRPLLDASKEISIIVGTVEEGEDFGLYNSALLLEDGVIKHVHRKVYPPTYGMFEESRYFLPGEP